jgi:pSer/pThr/pTyr-binding forkhead associated (FHA) protein
MICDECGHNNREGSLLCDNCHQDIYDILIEQVATKQLNSSPALALRLTEPASSRPLLLYLRDGAAPIAINRLNNLVIGRNNPDDLADVVDIDLSPFEAQDLGVSRKHVRIDARKEPPTVVDLGSANGTFINGEKLEAEKPEPIESGDELRLGRLVMRLYYK